MSATLVPTAPSAFDAPRLAGAALLRRLLTATVLVLGVLAALLPLSASAQAATQVTVPTATTEAASANAAAFRTGFAPGAGILWVDDATLARELDLMVSSGAQWLRLDFDWASVESVRGRYDWRNLDRVVLAARTRGIKVLALPAYTPKWARPAGTSSHHAPSDPAPFAAFAAAAAARYLQLGVDAYEIWNEPNIPNFWEPKPDVTAYAQMLKATSVAIKAVAPSVTVLSGGLSPASDEADGSYIDPRTFLTKLYALGAGRYIDAVAVHPYSFPALPSDVRTASWNTFQKMSTMRDTMVRNGDAGKKIWLTETGAPTGTARGAVSETQQAAIVTDTLTAASKLSWAGPTFLYAARDAGTDPTDREDNFGLVRRDFTPKPAWNALVRALHTVAPVTVAQPVTLTQPAAPQVPVTQARRSVGSSTPTAPHRRIFGPHIPGRG